MRKPLLLFLLPPVAFAQWVVHDPANTAVNAAIQAGQQANHVEVLRQWAAQLDQLTRQLRQLEEAVALQRRIRDVLGDPTLAGAGMVLRNLGPEDLAREYGTTLRAVQRLADASASLHRTSEGIFEKLDDDTSLGKPIARHESLYRRFSAIELQADRLAEVQDHTDARVAQLQTDLAESLTRLQSASTAAEVDKLNVQVSALNGQLVHLSGQKRDESDKLIAQQILNANQGDKERQDMLEKQIAEERQSLAIVDQWQRGVRLTRTNYEER